MSVSMDSVVYCEDCDYHNGHRMCSKFAQPDFVQRDHRILKFCSDINVDGSCRYFKKKEREDETESVKRSFWRSWCNFWLSERA